LGFPGSGAGAAERSACRAAIFSAKVIGFSVGNSPSLRGVTVVKIDHRFDAADQ
jgi:hypothetical protein